MNDIEIIETVVPLPQDILMKKFSSDNLYFRVDYDRCQIKNGGFLAYLENVDMRAFVDHPSVELIEQYIKTSHLIPFNNLCVIHANILLAVATNFTSVYDSVMLEYCGIDDIKMIYERNRDVIDLQIDILRNLPLYMMLNTETLFEDKEDLIAQNNIVTVDDNLLFMKVGKSFIQLVRMQNFPSLFMSPTLSEQDILNMKYYRLLDDYMFNRQNATVYLNPSNDVCALICAEVDQEAQS